VALAIRSNLKPGKVIRSLTVLKGDPAEEFGDMDGAKNDGLADLPWDGPTFEDWQSKNV
jgi:hypothetical protein